MKRTLLLASLMLLGFVSLAQAQKGTIRGTVYDAATGEAFPYVTVVIKGSQNGTVTDFDGKFSIKADPGTYSVQVSFISYKTLEISDVVVTAGEVTLLNDIQMQEDVEELDEIVVVGEAQRVTEAALLTIKKKSSYLIDGISSANFKRIGDGDAAAAAKRVPGVSVEGGRYIFVRGLGDRYTKSILNGMDIPGLDPDRNTLQMDIFPTNVLDNIIVVKSFTPEFAADFTGGIVNLETKDFPDIKSSSVSVGLGYNPSMHFNSNYLTYEGSSTDFLGFDNGDRDIPTGGRTDIPFRADAFSAGPLQDEYISILRSFNSNLAAMRQSSFMNFSLGFSQGDQKEWGNNTFGYNFAVTYKNDVDYYEDAEFNRYGLDNSDILELDRRERQVGEYGVNNVLVGLMGGVALKGDVSKYRLNVMHLQNGESKAGIFNYFNTDQGSNFEAIQHNLEYNQRALTNILLAGSHYLNQGKWEVDWKVSPTRSSLDDPDIRFTRIRVDGDDFTIGTESGLPERIWRELTEVNVASKVDVVNTFLNKKEMENKFRFGAAHTYKDREFNIQSFQFEANLADVTSNPDDFLSPDNLFAQDNLLGVGYNPTFIPRNTNLYEANVNVMGFYASVELAPTEKLKAIVGARAESYVQKYTGEDQTEEFVLDNQTVIDDFDIFPSVNLIYNFVENQNLRFSFSQTIARPSLKEASFANIIDPLTGRTFIGGFFVDEDPVTEEVVWDGNLRATNITNLDVRWEAFQSGGQTFSVSAFYKNFQNPIEIVQYQQAINNFQPRNVGDGRILGMEFEARKNLSFISENMADFSITTNVTLIDSRIELSETEFNSRVDNARDGQVIDDFRDMAGQAPYIINAGISYTGLDNYIDGGLFYNVQGSTLQFVGIADRPDVYTVPFNSLNLNISKGFGEDGKLNVGLKISNLLDDERESEFRNFGATDQIFQRLAPGRTFSLSLGYKF